MSIVTITDVAAHLRWTASQTIEYTAQMQGFIDGVDPVIESIVGAVNSAAYDEWYDGGAPILLVMHPPILTITSVTETFGSNVIRTLTEQPLDGIHSVDAYGYTWDPEPGEITRRISGMAAPFASGRRNVHVVYNAGRAVVPPNVRLGALELIRLTWKSQQGGPRPGFVASPGDLQPSEGEWRMGYFVPNWVMEMLAPSRRSWGIA